MMLNLVGNGGQLGITFIMNGIQGVQRTLQISSFAEKLHYAILKKNGQYLKLENKSLEEIFTCQLYDYGIRSIDMLINRIYNDITDRVGYKSYGDRILVKCWFKFHKREIRS
jgi:hypothetical protein